MMIVKKKSTPAVKFKDEQILKGIILIMDGLGLDLNDPNFIDTPDRVLRSYYEIYEGLQSKEKVKQILSTAFPSDYDGMVIVDNIVAFSMCPHHLLPVEYRVCVGYISKNKALGISKLARLVKLLAKKPALQEDFTQEITTHLMKELKAEGAMVKVYGRHMCMRMRGIYSPGSTTITSSVNGVFTESDVKSEFNMLSKGVKWNE